LWYIHTGIHIKEVFKIRRTFLFKGEFIRKIFIRVDELVAKAEEAGVPAIADPGRRMHGQLVRDQLKDMPARCTAPIGD
jgi:hypothetical protein